MDEQEPYLFIGGENDGQRIDIPQCPSGGPINLISFESQNGYLFYRRQDLATSTKIYTFYVAADMSLQDAVDSLFENYNPTEV